MCGDNPSTPAAKLCASCRKERKRRLNRSAVRRSRPPAQRPGTVTLQPTLTRQLISALNALIEVQPVGDDSSFGKRVNDLVRVLRPALITASEELIEAQRPKTRRSRRPPATLGALPALPP